MDETSFMSQVKAGSLLALGEYRHSKSEMLIWRDKQTGRPMEAPILRHTVEFGDCTVAVSERVPDGTKIENIHVPFVKGEMVVLHLEELTRNLGLVSARGKLEHFTPSPGDWAPVGGAPGTRNA
jgi:hypothetical protein